MNDDGSDVRRLTEDEAKEVYTAASPDGLRIVFLRGKEEGRGDAVVRNLRTGRLTQLTHHNGLVRLTRPTWSPDGNSVMFAESDKANRRLPAIQIDVRSGVETELPIDFVFDPMWSPVDPNMIVYDSFPDISTYDGNEIRNLTGIRDPVGNPHAHVPSWSPDGRSVAFAVGDIGNLNIGIVGLDGEPYRLVTRSGKAYFPIWSPSGDQIAYMDGTGGDQNIWIITPGHKNELNITNHPAIDSYPWWFEMGNLPVNPSGMALSVWGWFKKIGRE
ncbi:MAG: hypothetical protein O3A46_12000, partial [Candidatus Poribacteria bacterium]|nr:hypothetical protein [Candidatus Poribacteria bacterium]